MGETRDTNAGDLARSLTGLGVAVQWIRALPDAGSAVTAAFREAFDAVDLVVSTGGLGPTPDDLTREAIAAAVNETPIVDDELERWLRELWARRGMAFPEMNLKQAWLVPSATALPNPNGTAPGWWVDRPDGRIAVALPGPPREMRPMWTDHAVPRLVSRGVGEGVAVRTLRLAGIGESQVADVLGEALLRATDPIVATYARADAVDVRISARGIGAEGSTAAERVARTTEAVLAAIGEHVWAEGETTWAGAIGAELQRRGERLAVVEIGTGGSFETLLGDVEWLRCAELLGADTSIAREHRTNEGLVGLVRTAMEMGEAQVGVGVRIGSRGSDTSVSVAVVGSAWVRRERRVVFLGGANGRTRAALAAADITLRALRSAGEAPPPAAPRRDRRQR